MSEIDQRLEQLALDLEYAFDDLEDKIRTDFRRLKWRQNRHFYRLMQKVSAARKAE